MVHRFGDQVGQAIRKASQQVPKLVGTEQDSEIVFASRGTGSDSTAILSALKAQPERKEIIATVVEPPAVPNCFVTGDPGHRLPNTSNVAFEYIEGEATLLLLNKRGSATSSGLVRTSGSPEPSHVMRAMGAPLTVAHGTIRFSLSRYNWMEEIERVIWAVPPLLCNCVSSRRIGARMDRWRTRRRRLRRPMHDGFEGQRVSLRPDQET